MERIRKESIKRGTRTQVVMTFRLDADLQEYLQTKANKGRFINDLIRDAKGKEGKDEK